MAMTMQGGNRHSAHRRFAARARTRRRRSGQRRALMLGGVLPVLLASCVSGAPARRIVLSVPLDDPVPATPETVAAEGFAAVLPPTGPSFLAGRAARDQVRATLCLASAIYYEAATEPDEGQRAVAQVVLNRARHPAWPKTVCGVVYQGSDQAGCQFSFACDGAMARAPSLAWWTRARRVAEEALAGAVYAPVGSATFYHTTGVAPAWRSRLTPVATIGAHIFYRLPGDAADAALLPMRYAGGEPNPGPLPRIVPPAQLAPLQLAIAPVTDALVLPVAPPVTLAPAAPKPPRTVAEDKRYVPGALPESDVLPQYRNSGEWIAGR